MTLREFLLHHTDAGEVCYITDCGYNLAMCFIDNEDLFIRGMKSEALDREVFFTAQDNIKGMPVMHIEVK